MMTKAATSFFIHTKNSTQISRSAHRTTNTNPESHDFFSNKIFFFDQDQNSINMPIYLIILKKPSGNFLKNNNFFFMKFVQKFVKTFCESMKV